MATVQKPSPGLPFNQWPIYWKELSRDAIPSDRGIGDILERKAGIMGKAYKAAFLLIADRKCGCEMRQDKLNRLYPASQFPKN